MFEDFSGFFEDFSTSNDVMGWKAWFSVFGVLIFYPQLFLKFHVVCWVFAETLSDRSYERLKRRGDFLMKFSGPKELHS